MGRWLTPAGKQQRGVGQYFASERLRNPHRPEAKRLDLAHGLLRRRGGKHVEGGPDADPADLHDS